MKKSLALLVLTALLMAGCGSNAPESAPTPEPTTEAATPEPTPEPLTETDQIVFDLISASATSFEVPTSVRLVGGDILSAESGAVLDTGEAEACLRLTCENASGEIAEGYYWVIETMALNLDDMVALMMRQIGAYTVWKMKAACLKGDLNVDGINQLLDDYFAENADLEQQETAEMLKSVDAQAFRKETLSMHGISEEDAEKMAEFAFEAVCTMASYFDDPTSVRLLGGYAMTNGDRFGENAADPDEYCEALITLTSGEMLADSDVRTNCGRYRYSLRAGTYNLDDADDVSGTNEDTLALLRQAAECIYIVDVNAINAKLDDYFNSDASAPAKDINAFVAQQLINNADKFQDPASMKLISGSFGHNYVWIIVTLSADGAEDKYIIINGEMYNMQDSSNAAYTAAYDDANVGRAGAQLIRALNDTDTLDIAAINTALAEHFSGGSAAIPASTEPETAYAPTMGEKNALKSAESYLRFSPFSYSGLIDQLEFEGYSTSEATYAVDNCGADWNEQAVKAAESYLDFSAFSRQGLIEQLEYEGFTAEQATYGVDAGNTDWNEQAAKCAQEYLEFTSFSRQGFIDQLKFEGFTAEQAEYGVTAVGY